MKFEYLKVYKNGSKSVGSLDSSSVEAAKTTIKKLAPCTATIAAVYTLPECGKRTFPQAVRNEYDLSQLELIWEADNAK